jgi:integrase
VFARRLVWRLLLATFCCGDGAHQDLKGKNDVSEELVFRSPEGKILDPDNLYHRVFLPELAKAGIRRIRLHDLRHTFGSLLIQNGASIIYVKDQMGHSSIQVTVDI